MPLKSNMAWKSSTHNEAAVVCRNCVLCSTMHFWNTTTTTTHEIYFNDIVFRNHKNRLISLQSALYVELIGKLNNWNHLKNVPSAFSLHLLMATNVCMHFSSFNFSFIRLVVMHQINAAIITCVTNLPFEYLHWSQREFKNHSLFFASSQRMFVVFGVIVVVGKWHKLSYTK